MTLARFVTYVNKKVAFVPINSLDFLLLPLFYSCYFVVKLLSQR